MTEARWHRLVGGATLAAGELRRVRVGEREIVLVNDGGQYLALDGRCTHKPDALLAEGLLFRGAIVCPWHGFRFDVKTGRNVHPGGARPVACVPARVDGDDVLLQLSGAPDGEASVGPSARGCDDARGFVAQRPRHQPGLP
jgi:nitrite reductase/ring-hydroxylating ferredoxin subunit